jgi:enterochelin esterase-like enzyme
LKPRDIVVWLPPGYDDKVGKKYPVLYMNDGQNVFDPATSSFGYDWRADEVADSLIKAGAISEIIIVGIYNTEDRRREYKYTSLGYTYMDFVVNRLKPFIDKEYKTLPDKKNTAVCGSSAGGLISFMIAWNYPEIFSKAACLSPAFKIQELNYVDTIVNYSGNKKNIKLYIDNGGIGIDSALQPGTNEMVAALLNKGYELGKDIIWYVDKNASHFETAWAARIWRPMVFFFGRKE